MSVCDVRSGLHEEAASLSPSVVIAFKAAFKLHATAIRAKQQGRFISTTLSFVVCLEGSFCGTVSAAPPVAIDSSHIEFVPMNHG